MKIYLLLALILLSACAAPARKLNHQELVKSKSEFVANYEQELAEYSAPPERVYHRCEQLT